MKRLYLLLMLLLCLTGCAGGTEVSGEVLKVGLEPDSYSYLMIQTENKEMTVTFDDATAILSFVEDNQAVEEGDTVSVTLDGGKKHGSAYARTILVQARLRENGAVLADGTVLDIMDHGSYRIYLLKDGTELLDQRKPTGPENVFAGGLYFDDLPEAVQEQVAAYFAERGLRYDIREELEQAWRMYQEQGEEFRCLLVSQDITPTAANEHIIAFQTAVTVPSEDHHSIQYREGTVFDRETGELIDNRALFNRDMDAVLAELLDRNGVAEPERSEMIAAFKPEYVLLFDEYLEVEFPYGTILGYKVDDVKDLLQPWAVMEQNPD